MPIDRSLPRAASQASADAAQNFMRFVGQGQGNETNRGQKDLSSFNTEGNPLFDLMDAAHTIQQGQELQKQLRDPSLQPTLIEAFMASKGAAPGLQYKQEMRGILQNVQQAYIAQLFNSGRQHLIEAFYKPLKDKEIQALIARDSQMKAPAREMNRQVQEYVNSPELREGESGYRSPEELAIGENTPYIPGLNTAGFESNPVLDELRSRHTATPNFLDRLKRQEMLAPKLLAAQLVSGGAKNVGDYVKGLEELRKQRAFEQFSQDEDAGQPAQPVTIPQAGPVFRSGLGQTSVIPRTNAEREEFRQDLAAANGDRVKALETFNARRAQRETASAQGQEQGQPLQVAPFPSRTPRAILESKTLTAEGGVSITKKPTSLDDRITSYVRGEIARLGPQAIGPALQEASRGTGGGAPKAEQLAELKAEATQAAYLQARQRLQGQYQDPALHKAAMQEAARTLGGYFNGKGLEQLQDPIALRRAETTATLEAGGQYKTESPLAAQERSIDVVQQERTAGAQAKGLTVGKAAGLQATSSSDLKLAASDPEGVNFYYNRETGERLTGEERASDVSIGQKEGKIIKLPPQQANKLLELRGSAAAMQPLLDKYEKIYGPQGIFAKLHPGIISRILAGKDSLLAQVSQSDPALVSAIRQSSIEARRILRAAGESGAFSNEDNLAAQEALVKLDGLPDTPDTARQLLGDIVTRFNRQIGNVLENPNFKSDKYLRAPRIIVAAKRKK